MLTPVPPTDCMRAREAASLRVDGELRELDAVRLDLHLRDCPACRGYAREIEAVTLALRSAPLEQPAPFVSAPRAARRSRLAIGLAGVAATAVAALAATGVGVEHALRPAGPATVAAVPDDVPSLKRDSLNQHVLALLGPATGVYGRLLVV